jgi:ATP-dependent Clp protease adaptor protein ClpS
MKYSTETEQQQDVDVLDVINLEKKLILHNDQVNTFEWVIETLVKICKHSEEQAEQCAYIIHHKGKYAVKQGSFETLKPMKDAIADRGINVTIE